MIFPALLKTNEEQQKEFLEIIAGAVICLHLPNKKFMPGNAAFIY